MINSGVLCDEINNMRMSRRFANKTNDHGDVVWFPASEVHSLPCCFPLKRTNSSFAFHALFSVVHESISYRLHLLVFTASTPRDQIADGNYFRRKHIVRESVGICDNNIAVPEFGAEGLGLTWGVYANPGILLE